MLKDNIKKHRERHGLTKAALARLVDVSDVSVSYWESGHIKNIGSSHLLALGKVFGITVSELLDDELLDQPLRPGLNWAIARCQALQSQGFTHSRHEVLIRDFKNCLGDS